MEPKLAYFLRQAHAPDEKAHIGCDLSAKGMWRGVIVYEEKILIPPLRNLVAEIVVLRAATHVILVETGYRTYLTWILDFAGVRDVIDN